MRIQVKNIGTEEVVFNTYKEEVTLAAGESFTDHVYDGEIQRIRGEYRGLATITEAHSLADFPQGRH